MRHHSPHAQCCNIHEQEQGMLFIANSRLPVLATYRHRLLFLLLLLLLLLLLFSLSFSLLLCLCFTCYNNRRLIAVPSVTRLAPVYYEACACVAPNRVSMTPSDQWRLKAWSRIRWTRACAYKIQQTSVPTTPDSMAGSFMHVQMCECGLSHCPLAMV
jgi:hypothetical protein